MDTSQQQSASVVRAVTRRIHPLRPDAIRLWTIQPLTVWHDLQEKKALFVDSTQARFGNGQMPAFHAAYDWLREQMARRLPGYEGHYPWWAYEHFLDLRFYRFHCGHPPDERLVRLELCVPKEQVLLSCYGAWYCVHDRWYLPQAVETEECERESDTWHEAAKRAGVDIYRREILPEPWESQMRASWERIFDVEARREREIIQATFERLELADVVKVTEFTAQNKKPFA